MFYILDLSFQLLSAIGICKKLALYKLNLFILFSLFLLDLYGALFEIDYSSLRQAVRRRSCPEGPRLDTTDDSPSLPTNNGVHSYDNKGFESEAQQDGEQCVVAEGQTPVTRIDEREKENSDEDLGQDKLLYQCLKIPDTSRQSIYEPLIRTGPVTEVSIDKVQCFFFKCL